MGGYKCQKMDFVTNSNVPDSDEKSKLPRVANYEIKRMYKEMTLFLFYSLSYTNMIKNFAINLTTS